LRERERESQAKHKKSSIYQRINKYWPRIVKLMVSRKVEP